MLLLTCNLRAIVLNKNTHNAKTIKSNKLQQETIVLWKQLSVYLLSYSSDGPIELRF